MENDPPPWAAAVFVGVDASLLVHPPSRSNTTTTEEMRFDLEFIPPPSVSWCKQCRPSGPGGAMPRLVSGLFGDPDLQARYALGYGDVQDPGDLLGGSEHGHRSQ